MYVVIMQEQQTPSSSDRFLTAVNSLQPFTPEENEWLKRAFRLRNVKAGEVARRAG